MPAISLLQALGIMVVVATAMILLLRPLRLPSIVVCIAAGLVIGPVLGLVELQHGGDSAAAAADAAIEGITHLGIVLLLFLVGLELSFDRVRQVGGVAFVAAIGQVIVTTIAGGVACLAMGFPLAASLVIALCLTFSSTVVVIRLLEQRHELGSLHGRIAVGVLLVEDMLVIVGLTLLHGIGSGEEGGGGGVGDTLLRLPLAFVSMAVLLAIALGAAKFLLATPFTWAARRSETLIVWGLAWCLAFVGLATWLGLSPEIGAFLAGISLAQLPAAADLNRRLHPLMTFFIAIFFVAIGAGTDLAAARETWFAAVVLGILVLTLKPFSIVWLIARCGYGERTAFFAGATLAQISEFSFIFATVALGAGLLDANAVGLVTMVGLGTIVISSLLFGVRDRLHEFFVRRGWTRIFGAGEEALHPAPPPRTGHVVVVGMNSMGRRIVARLAARGVATLAIDTDPGKLAGLPGETLHGSIDDRGTLEAADLPTAAFAITALQIEEVNALFAHRCREAGVPCAAHAFDGSVVESLGRLGSAHLLDSKMQGNIRLMTLLAEEGILLP